MKILFLSLMGMLLLTGCASSVRPKAIVAVPWNDQKKMDELAQNYAAMEDDAVYEGGVSAPAKAASSKKAKP